MPDTFTAKFNLTKPEVGSSRDAWGAKWNDNADKIDAALQKPTGASSKCDVIWIDSATCRLVGNDGNTIIIGGQPVVIPAAGVDFKFTTGAGVVAGNNYLVAFLDNSDPANPKPGLKAAQTARTVHSTLGYATCGVDAETLVAGFYAQTDKTVRYSLADKHFSGWHTRFRPRCLTGAMGNTETMSTTYVEVNTALRVSAYMWADKPVTGFASGDVPSVTYGAIYTAVSLDNSTQIDQIRELSGAPSGVNPSSINPASPSGPLEPKTDGMHFISAMTRVFYAGSRNQWNDVRVSALV